MIKSLVAASLLCLAMTAPAFAGSGGCDDTDAWTKMEADITALPDGAEKTAALAEWKMANDSKTAKNMNECDNHMNEAGKKGGVRK